MNKIVVTVITVIWMNVCALAQGSINLTDTNINPGIATDNATAWLTGTVTLQVWWLAGTGNTAAIDAINAADLAGNGTEAVSLLSFYGFTQEFIGDVVVNEGTFIYNLTGVSLPNIPTATQNTFALVGNDNQGLEGAIAFVNADGGNQSSSVPGPPANLTGWDLLGQNLILTPIPEPATIDLAGLGSLSLFLFRRK